MRQIDGGHAVCCCGQCFCGLQDPRRNCRLKHGQMRRRKCCSSAPWKMHCFCRLVCLNHQRAHGGCGWLRTLRCSAGSKQYSGPGADYPQYMQKLLPNSCQVAFMQAHAAAIACRKLLYNIAGASFECDRCYSTISSPCCSPCGMHSRQHPVIPRHLHTFASLKKWSCSVCFVQAATTGRYIVLLAAVASQKRQAGGRCSAATKLLYAACTSTLLLLVRLVVQQRVPTCAVGVAPDRYVGNGGGSSRRVAAAGGKACLLSSTV